MRLIDADKLMESLDPKESVWVGLVLSELIANAPTVEAIPVKWLRQWFAENRFKFYDDNDNIYLVADIEEMLLEWEKENETNRR